MLLPGNSVKRVISWKIRPTFTEMILLFIRQNTKFHMVKSITNANYQGNFRDFLFSWNWINLALGWSWVINCFCGLWLRTAPFHTQLLMRKSIIIQNRFSSTHGLLIISSSIKSVPYKFYVLGQIGLSKQCRARSDCWRSSLIRVYTVCHFISIFWML